MSLNSFPFISVNVMCSFIFPLCFIQISTSVIPIPTHQLSFRIPRSPLLSESSPVAPQFSRSYTPLPSHRVSPVKQRVKVVSYSLSNATHFAFILKNSDSCHLFIFMSIRHCEEHLPNTLNILKLLKTNKQKSSRIGFTWTHQQ